MIKYGKRYFLHRLAGLVTFSAANFALARVTPRQSLGPFYPSTLPLDRDSDLTFVEGKKGRASGHVTNLYGRLYSVDGSFLPQANIEIWQCDAFGGYHHPSDGGGKDPFFQGYGKTMTDDKGQFRFKTIKPVAYPGRAPHIHLRISKGSKELVTQIYVHGNPANRTDFLLNSIPSKEARQSLMIPFKDDPNGAVGELVAIFNPIIG